MCRREEEGILTSEWEDSQAGVCVHDPELPQCTWMNPTQMELEYNMGVKAF